MNVIRNTFGTSIPLTGTRVRRVTSVCPAFEILFDGGRLKIRLDAFEAVSEPLGLADGTRYALRVAVSADGRLTAWLDGREVIAKTGVPSPDSWKDGPSGKKTPTIAFGGERGGATLDGFLDDILLADKALGAPGRASAAADYSRIARPEYRVASAADASEALVFDASGKAKTGGAYNDSKYAFGFEELVDYWHFDESASLASSDTSHSYGSCYLDWDLDRLILSRRQLGADMAAEEGRLVRYLGMKHKDDPAKLAKIAALVREGADAGSMTALDAALEELLKLL